MNKKQFLYKSFLELKNESEVEAYLEDLLTPAEIEEFSERLRIARLLSSGVKYSQIALETKASTRTIARVASWLKNGRKGYELVLARLHHHPSSKTHL